MKNEDILRHYNRKWSAKLGKFCS